MDIRKWLQGATATQPPPTPPPTENEGNAPSSSITGTTSEELEPCSSTSQYTPASQAHPPAAANVSAGDQPIDDLGTDQPNQIVLKQYPYSILTGRRRSFVSAWYHNQDWLEYSVKADAAFCFCCWQSS